METCEYVKIYLADEEKLGILLRFLLHELLHTGSLSEMSLKLLPVLGYLVTNWYRYILIFNYRYRYGTENTSLNNR